MKITLKRQRPTSLALIQVQMMIQSQLRKSNSRRPKQLKMVRKRKCNMMKLKKLIANFSFQIVQSYHQFCPDAALHQRSMMTSLHNKINPKLKQLQQVREKSEFSRVSRVFNFMRRCFPEKLVLKFFIKEYDINSINQNFITLKLKSRALKPYKSLNILECLILYGFKDVNYGVTEVYLQFTN